MIELQPHVIFSNMPRDLSSCPGLSREVDPLVLERFILLDYCLPRWSQKPLKFCTGSSHQGQVCSERVRHLDSEAKNQIKLREEKGEFCLSLPQCL